MGFVDSRHVSDDGNRRGVVVLVQTELSADETKSRADADKLPIPVSRLFAGAAADGIRFEVIAPSGSLEIRGAENSKG